MTLRIPAKVLLHVWSYDFYDMTLSTGKQRRHMIKDEYMIKILHFFLFHPICLPDSINTKLIIQTFHLTL